MNRRPLVAHLAIYAGLLITSSCLPPRIGRPAWSVSHRHAAYPIAHYLLGVGQGADLQTAEKNARADLAAIIDRNYRAAVEQAGPAWAGASKPSVKLDPEVAVRWSSSDGSRNAVLVALDRNKISEALLTEIAGLEKSCTDDAAQAAKALKSERDTFAALTGYLRALSERVSAERRRLLLAALAPKAAGAPQGPQPKELEDSIGKLLGSLELVAISGGGQRADASGRLVLPLVVGAYRVSGAEKFPAKNLPLIFSAPGIEKGLRLVTSEVGTCSASVQGLAPAKPDASRVEVRLDKDAILRAADVDPGDQRYRAVLDKVEIHGAHFTYLSKGQAATRAMILIEESHLGRRVAHSGLGTSLGRKLAERGLLLIDPRVASTDLALTETLAEAPEATKNYADVLIYGSVTSTITRQLSASFIFCKADCDIKVVELASGRKLGAVAKSVTEAGRDERSSCQRALVKLSRKSVPVLAPLVHVGDREQKP